MTSGPLQTPTFDRLGDYDVLAPISDGGMAAVYLARVRQQEDQLVALKVIRREHSRDRTFVSMFLDEARIAARLSHPNIVAVHGIGHASGRHYLVMELLRGRTLLEIGEAAAARGEKIPYDVIAWMGARIAHALHYVHELKDERGVPQQAVHRDVTPANILVTLAGEPKLLDFGLAKARDRIGTTAAGYIKGKLAYLAPEQARGQSSDRRGDIFSLGVTLWELSLGRRLFKQADDVETVRRVMGGDIPDPVRLAPDYPPRLAEIIRRALERNPVDRYPTAKRMASDLEAFLGQRPRVDAGVVAHLLETLFPPETSRPWELLAARPDSRSSAASRIDTVSLGEQLSVPADNTVALDRVAVPRDAATLLRAAEDSLARMGAWDAVTRARGQLVGAFLHEVFGDRERARALARLVLEVAPSAAAHAMCARLAEDPAHRIEQVQAAIAMAQSAKDAAALLGELGWLASACGKQDIARDAFERALTMDASDPAALKGLELLGFGEDTSRHAAHLERMATAWRNEPGLAAWIQVERAGVLEQKSPAVARDALHVALELDGKFGPVRDACVAFAERHRDWEWLAELLRNQGAVEPGRQAELLCEVSAMAELALLKPDLAQQVLREIPNGAASNTLERRVADARVRTSEARDDLDGAIVARTARIALIEDSRRQACAWRVVAELESKRGQNERAIEALRKACAGRDPDAVTALQDALERVGRHDDLADLLESLANEEQTPQVRAQQLTRAARIRLQTGDRSAAERLLQRALVIAPSDREIAEELLFVLTTPPSEAAAAGTRTRLAVHAHAAAQAPDDARKIVHLEAMASLQEELLADLAGALQTRALVVSLDPKRMSAVVALGRAARRVGDVARYADALVEESALVTAADVADGLRLRAAEVLGPTDPERSIRLVRDVLARHPAHPEARRLERRHHARTEQWALVDRSLAEESAAASDPPSKQRLAVERARIHRDRLGAVEPAIALFEQALSADPEHGGVLDELVQSVESLRDLRAKRAAFVRVASIVSSPVERVLLLIRAAEIDEFALQDDRAALDALGQASALQDEPWLRARRARISSRLPGAPLGHHLNSLMQANAELSRGALDEALQTLEPIVAAEPSHAPLRMLERVARAKGSMPLLANALAAEVACFADPSAKMAALWGEIHVVQWKLPGGDIASMVDAIASLAPTNRAVLDAQLASAAPRAGRGDVVALRRACAALDGLARLSVDDTSRVAMSVVRGALHAEAGEREAALAAFLDALEREPKTIAAAMGAASLGAELQRPEAEALGLFAMGRLTDDPAERAAHLAAAADRLARSSKQGGAADKAAQWAEEALRTDPDNELAWALTVRLRSAETHASSLLSTLRDAFERAGSPSSIVRLGMDIARIAKASPDTRLFAIEALRRIRAVAPDHAPALRWLADSCREEGAMVEWRDALETLGACPSESPLKVAALFELATHYLTSPERLEDAERVLRRVLDIEPSNAKALRELVRLRRGASRSEEVQALLSRLGEAEGNAESRGQALIELADMRLGAGDKAGAEAALVEAESQLRSGGLLGRLVDLYRGSPGEQARALGRVVAKCTEAGGAHPIALARLGELEIDVLGKAAVGVDHLRAALGILPAMPEARAALARGLLATGRAKDASRTLLDMIVPEASSFVALRDAGGALITLERALGASGSRAEGFVARELAAVAGGLDDGAHVELRARRLASASLPANALSRDILAAEVVPDEGRGIVAAIVQALSGLETKVARTDAEALGFSPKERVKPNARHPLWPEFESVARALGLTPPSLGVVQDPAVARVGLIDGEAWALVPEGFMQKAEPEQRAMLGRLLTRIALGVPWLDELATFDVFSMLVGAIRKVSPEYASDVIRPNEEHLVDDFSTRMDKLMSRRQKKAIAELLPQLSSQPTLTPKTVEAFCRAIVRTELRVAFLVTGDLLAALDTLQGSPWAFWSQSDMAGPRALAALFGSPIASDVARYALGPQATMLRRRLGTTWD